MRHLLNAKRLSPSHHKYRMFNALWAIYATMKNIHMHRVDAFCLPNPDSKEFTVLMLDIEDAMQKLIDEVPLPDMMDKFIQGLIENED